ncbi:glycine cleavage system aminomethyltransferase GcvT [Pyruvatibacter mobilis]|uniref:glycine cleavage system aminomethyltransferase GcvT n=1 Tax=Pyruvatibacter mobilis TaxID=1712261 RepID=UPI003BACE48A
MADIHSDDLKTTPLHALHIELGGKMVPFAGYDMPVQYPLGVLGEHLHTRAKAGLFDVSHMGQAFLIGPDHDTTAGALEALVPGDMRGLGLGQQRYTVLLTDEGGIIDDLMVTRSTSEDDDGRLMLVVNAARKDVDYAHIKSRLPDGVRLETRDDRALLALQGPMAADVLGRHCPQAAGLSFMEAASGTFDGIDLHLSRSGYTGEDGYEISVAADKAEDVARALLAHEEVEPIGLGARDSLRLEAGLCLYGSDIDETTSPVEAAIAWVIPKHRREAGDFPGAERILKELADGPARKRVGILPEGKAPARAHTEIHAGGTVVGEITSGGFGPTADGPVAMGYVAAEHAKPGTDLDLMVRGKPRPAKVAKMPFAPHRYAK